MKPIHKYNKSSIDLATLAIKANIYLVVLQLEKAGNYSSLNEQLKQAVCKSCFKGSEGGKYSLKSQKSKVS